MMKKTSFHLLVFILVLGFSVCAVAESIRIKDGSRPNVRTLPSTDGEIVGIATSNQIYEVLSVSDNNWYKIRLEDGSVGWVAGGMVEKISSQNLTSPVTKNGSSLESVGDQRI